MVFHDTIDFAGNKTTFLVYFSAGVSQTGARTGLQLLGHGDMQRFNSSSLAFTFLWSFDGLFNELRRATPQPE